MLSDGNGLLLQHWWRTSGGRYAGTLSPQTDAMTVLHQLEEIPLTLQSYTIHQAPSLRGDSGDLLRLIARARLGVGVAERERLALGGRFVYAATGDIRGLILATLLHPVTDSTLQASDRTALVTYLQAQPRWTGFEFVVLRLVLGRIVTLEDVYLLWPQLTQAPSVSPRQARMRVPLQAAALLSVLRHAIASGDLPRAQQTQDALDSIPAALLDVQHLFWRRVGTAALLVARGGDDTHPGEALFVNLMDTSEFLQSPGLATALNVVWQASRQIALRHK